MHKKRQKMNRTAKLMIYSSQLDRLKKDSKELKEFIKVVEKEGNQVLVNKLKKKFEYLNSRILQISSNSNQKNAA